MIERLEIKREKTAVEAQLTVAEVPKEKETRKIEQWQNRAVAEQTLSWLWVHERNG